MEHGGCNEVDNFAIHNTMHNEDITKVQDDEFSDSAHNQSDLHSNGNNTSDATDPFSHCIIKASGENMEGN